MRTPQTEGRLTDTGGERPLGTGWHAWPSDESAAAFGVDPDAGLSDAEAGRRLASQGPNALAERGGPRWPRLLARQFASALIWILAAAAAVSFAIGEVVDAAAIVLILLLNAALGFSQEWRAERAIAALRRLLAPHCTVRRDGSEREIDATRLVPGDVVVLETGARVPADLRLVEAVRLRIDESALTGESLPVAKSPEAVSADAALAEQSSMAWMGTDVTDGRARGLVVATGGNTAFGRIAELTRRVPDEVTPLQRRLAVLGRQLGLLAVGVSALVALAGWGAGRDLAAMFLMGVSLAVAVVPEGLPAVVTITLALGVRAMARRRALLRRLPAAETLGAATVVCTDKTGTLTANEMTVRRVWLPAGEVEVGGSGYEPRGDFEADGRAVDPAGRPDLRALLECGLRCNRARIEPGDAGWRAIGEPTEAALVVAARKAGIELADAPREAEIPFDSVRKRMSVVDAVDGGLLVSVKGAPEVLLERCAHVLVGEEERPLDAEARRRAERAAEALAEGGLRTLALARRRLPVGASLDEESLERDLVLLGVAGILDPPRPEVASAVARARDAGIRVLMITGDAAATARAIADRIGLPVTRVLHGRELEGLSDAELSRALGEPVLLARTTPEHKLRVVSLLQAAGHVTAMTGDGVNDAPALKKADIGIAMGRRGTDVAKSASDMVLTDDDFATIVGAIEEGRRQFDNIRKFVGNLVSSNLGEVVAIAGNIAIGGPLIFLPAQILWINLVTDGLTSLALGVEPAERDLMARPPRPREAPIVGRGQAALLLGMGLYVGVVTLALYEWARGQPDPGRAASAQTLAFTGLIVLELVNSLNFRTLAAPLSATGLLSNPWLLAAIAGSAAVHAAAVYSPLGATLLHVVPLRAADWGLLVAVALPLLAAVELGKRRRWRPRGGGLPPI